MRPLVCVLLGFQAGLLAWQAYGDSATWDEIGHFSAGVDHWRHGRFDMYCVNPPLVRMVALAPVVILDSNLDPEESCPLGGPGQRPEFSSGAALAAAAGIRYFLLLTFARWMSIPFALLGGWICYTWASALWGQTSGLLSLTLWVVSPTVLAYGHLITPDMGAAGLGVAAMYVFRSWLLRPSGGHAAAAGAMLGLAELTKTTWVILFALLPILWLIYLLLAAHRIGVAQWFTQGWQMVLMLLLGLWVLNAGYAFDGSFKPLREFQFISESLGGPDRREVFSDVRVGNRFTNSWMGNVRVPLPENYLLGVDLVKFEYEKGYWSYLNGQWKLGGWWYYYLYAMLIKEPLGTWGLGVVAVGAVIICGGKYAAAFREELLLLAPAVAVIALVSSQTGFNHHLRYVLPAFPFLFILISRVGKSLELGHWQLATAAGLLLAWSVVGSLRVVPHSVGYFNELGGGPYGGHYHLGASNVDWGQDLLYLAEWYKAHPKARPMHLAYDLPLIDPKLAGIESLAVPVGPHSDSAGQQMQRELGPAPGWYAVSANKIHNREKDYDYFLNFKPVGYAGYSMYIYHITPAEANRVRRNLGMPPLATTQPEPAAATTGGEP